MMKEMMITRTMMNKQNRKKIEKISDQSPFPGQPFRILLLKAFNAESMKRGDF